MTERQRLARPLTRTEIETGLRAAGINPVVWFAAVEAYTEGDYEYMRQAVLTPRDQWPDDVTWYDLLRLQVNLIQQGLQTLPAYSGTVYRGMDLQALSDFQGGVLAVGENVKMETLTSFSRRPDVRLVYNKPVVFEVTRNLSGVSIEAASIDPSEAEVLVYPPRYYRVVQVVQRTQLQGHPLSGRSGWYVLMEELP